MNQAELAYFELRFKNQFLESNGNSFQELFVRIMSKLHPDNFIPCAPWGNIGDRKNDGYLKSERTLFQVYAPKNISANKTIKKIDNDFHGALTHWQNNIDNWVFVHNSHIGLPPPVIKKLLELREKYPNIKIEHWGFEELLLRIRLLSLENLISLFGSPTIPNESKKADKFTKEAQELMRDGKHNQAIEKMEQALTVAKDEQDVKKEVETLIGLVLLSTNRGNGTSAKKYLDQITQKIDKVESLTAKVMYLRAQAQVCTDTNDKTKAMSHYKEAIQLCNAHKDDEKGNLATQGCLIRSLYIHLLCDKKRLAEAKSLLIECEEYARNKKQELDGELFQSALGAGIHYSVANNNDKDAIKRIIELEEYVSNARLANRIGRNLINIANRLSSQKNHKVAIVAAESVIRIGHKFFETKQIPGLLTAALYTEALIIANTGNDSLALVKAEALLNLCIKPEDAVIKQAALHLIAEIKRVSGDSQTAVNQALEALKSANGTPEEIAFTKMALARALDDNGQTEDALKQIMEAWLILPRVNIHEGLAMDFLSKITDYASQLGIEENVNYAFNEIDKIISNDKKIINRISRAKAQAEANFRLRTRLIEVMNECEASKPEIIKTYRSFHEANAAAFSPLLKLWDECPENIGVCYDFWGRGSFERILNNTKAFSNSFNITIEVRSLEDVKGAIRLWGLYADLLILLWKGPTKNGFTMFPLPEDYWEPGGSGYMVAYGDEYVKEGSEKKYHLAMAHISIFPDEIANFLATEARLFLQLGRLIIVPAISVGCVNPGHGPFEQLIAEACNSIPSLNSSGIKGIPIGFIPYSPNVPFETLAEFGQVENERLSKLRILLLKQSQKFTPGTSQNIDLKIFSLEITDALRDIEEENKRFARKKGIVNKNEPLNISNSQFLKNGMKLSNITSDSPFSPLFILDSIGYGWKIGSPERATQSKRFEPEKENIIGTWLVPPEPGWLIPTFQKID